MGVAWLRVTLDIFVDATGLAINFGKSTLVPMLVDVEALRIMVASMQCTVGESPQTYLGLPHNMSDGD